MISQRHLYSYKFKEIKMKISLAYCRVRSLRRNNQTLSILLSAENNQV